MAVTSSTGSSGLDVNGIVSQLMTVERRPINQLNSRQASYQAQLSAFGTIKNSLAAFQTALQGLKSGGSFQAFKTTPADTSILNATASASAVAGSYAIDITSLAQSQQLVAVGQASATTAIGGGAATTLSFDFGTISGGTFNATSGTYTGAAFASNGGGIKTVSISNTNNTLQGIRDAINAANIGVTATIINDGSATPYRIALSSNIAGASNSMSISVSGDAAIGSLLSNDPAGAQNMMQTITAQNANFKVNGVAISKASNTVSDAIQGVTLNLGKVTAATTTLTVSKDNGAVSSAANAFVKAYNDLTNTLQNLSAYNASTKSGAVLQGDSTVRMMSTQLRDMLNATVPGGTYSTLSQVGITFQKDGTLALDSTKLDAAVTANMAGVANLFSSASGYVTKLDQWTTTALGSTGMISSRTDGLNSSIKDITNQVAALETRMTSIEQRYRTQFTALDAMLSRMNQTQNYLNQQLSSLQNNKL